MKSPVFVGIAGGTASGKTTVCHTIKEALGVECTVVAMDAFYKGIPEDQLHLVHEYNFDHPNALDHDEIYSVVNKLLNWEDAEMPVYDFKTHKRLEETQNLPAANFVILEGIYALYEKRMRDLMSLKIFVQTDDDIRLGRRMLRDRQERGRDIEGILNQYFKFVKPSYDEYIKPTMKKADIIVPHGAKNQVAIDLIVMNLRHYLQSQD